MARDGYLMFTNSLREVKIFIKIKARRHLLREDRSGFGFRTEVSN